MNNDIYYYSFVTHTNQQIKTIALCDGRLVVDVDSDTNKPIGVELIGMSEEISCYREVALSEVAHQIAEFINATYLPSGGYRKYDAKAIKEILDGALQKHGI